MPVYYFYEAKTGEIVSRLINDTTMVKDLITQHFPQFVSGIILLIGVVKILRILDWKMALVFLVAIIMYGGIRVQEVTLMTGTLIAFLLYLFQIIFPVTFFVTFCTQLQKAKGVTESIIEILSMESEDLEK